jgi:DNA-binding ferritin-like protein
MTPLDDILRSYEKQAQDSNVLASLFEHRIKIHLMHLVTSSYAQHKALGKLYEAVDDFIDTFAEMYMGAKGDKDLAKSVSSLSVAPGGDPVALVNDLEQFLKGSLTQAIGEDQTALLNLRDELIGTAQTTKYLLTLN